MKMPRRLHLVVAVAVATTTAGCMGSFALTKGLYAWNDSVTGNKIINNVIFWGLAILPVYELAVFGDVVILNTIEFWTGTKLLGEASDPAAADTAVAVAEDAEGNIRIARGDDVFVLVPESADRVRVYKNGAVVGFAERAIDGSVTAFDAAGDVVSIASAADVAVASDVAADAVR